jgi:hypothetical protein
MEIKVSNNLMRSEREASTMYAPKFRHDRHDVYLHFSDRLDVLTQGIVINYVCIEVNINPDFDW